MRRGACSWVLAGLLIVAGPVCAQTHGSARQVATAVARQQAEVQRLQKDVAKQESGSQAAAEKLRRQDAEIAELRRQLQAVQQAREAVGKGH
ncbi:hypothetical protein [Rhodanobacter hydrolyticus]|uniref:Peptidase M23 n=1 Tax=Rhodanobacter hydrolyticus TaxID=2250595 RepID=A0ABW8IZX5_9GAMM